MRLIISCLVSLCLATMSWGQQVNKLSDSGQKKRDQSRPLSELMDHGTMAYEGNSHSPRAVETATFTAGYQGVSIEQRVHGDKPGPRLIASFDGLGVGFKGPQGGAYVRNPSDNSLAVGKDHIIQTVNSRMAIFTKKGDRYDETGRPLYGPVETKNVFRGFGGPCEQYNNGDAVVRYDQLADRWLIVMPIFRRLPVRENEPVAPEAGPVAVESTKGIDGQPGDPEVLFQPPHSDEEWRPGPRRRSENTNEGSFCMCYAVSTSPDPFGSYYRYEFVRPLFPDYPRPAVWPDGYYVPTSTGDHIIEKHACVVDRNKMLQGEDASEQCFIIDDVSFLNNADLDGFQLPDAGAPNIMLATGGSQLNGDFEDDGIYAWKFHVDWENAAKSRLEGPEKIPVVPYHFLCDGQLTNCVPQPTTDQHLDSQGDKLMSRVVYRKIGDQHSILAVHSVRTENYGGGVRWYEFRLNQDGDIRLYQQGTYCPGGNFRWMASPAMDKFGNIGIGYSFGGYDDFAGQRFAGRQAGDPLGILTLRETILVEGEDAQTNTLRWEDYTQTAVDPTDDCTIWYVGDYYMKGGESYSTRIGAFRMPGCGEE